MDPFPDCVAQAQTYLYDLMPDLHPEARAIIKSDRIPEFAQSLSGCVEGFVNGELRGVPVGRAGPIKFFPAIGDYGAKAFSKMEESQVAHVSHLMGVTIGMGYVLVSSTADEMNAGRSREPNELWEMWVSTISSDFLESQGLPDDLVGFFRNVGADAFAPWVGKASGGRLAGGKLKRSGGYYTQAGMVLRGCQLYEGDFPGDPLAQLWPFGDYVT
jgi:hypothetical protein